MSDDSRPGTKILFVLVALGASLLTYCGGETSDDGGKGSVGGTAGVGGTGGTSGSSGTGGGGWGSGGCGSDTCNCGSDPCHPACGGCPDSGGAGDAGLDAGSADGSTEGSDGEAGDGEASTDGAASADASDGDPTPDAFAPFRSAPMQQSRACYRLTGYQHDSCLPADDAVLPWLTTSPKGRAQHIVAGPYLAREPEGRSCCYSVSVNPLRFHGSKGRAGEPQ